MATDQTLSLSWPEPDVALVTIDMPGKGANVLSTSVLRELSELLDTVEKRSDVAAMILISGKPGQFVAGADLREFVASLDMPQENTVEVCRRGQSLFARLSQASFVTVAAIEGVCLGGGAELAVWCDRRVMSDHPKTEYGFPEVKLGLFPGWGGTVRAPRMVGLGNAVEMITGGESVSAREAYAMGWVSDVVPPERLLASAMRIARLERQTSNYLRDRKTWAGAVDMSVQELGFLGATASAVIQQQTKGHYPAPMAALEAMMNGSLVDAQAACQIEAEGMARLFGSPINAALLNVFFLTDRNKKDRGVVDASLEPRSIHAVGVVGAGIMGAGIAAANVKRGNMTTITDTRAEAVTLGMRSVLEEVAYDRTKKSKDVEKAIEFAPLLRGGTAITELQGCDLAIEAVVENVDVKREVIRQLESIVRDDAILASNTSTIPISILAEGLQHPDRFCGIHFFNPVRKMKLVEIIRGRETSESTIATAVAYAKRIGKMPIVVSDGPGFLVNRLLTPYMSESLELLREGVPIKDIERAAKQFGMPMGPMTLYDMVGLDTALFAGKVMTEAFPDRFTANPILPGLVKAERLGKKSGAGFFSYQNKKGRAEPDPELDRFLQPHVADSPRKASSDELTHRLFLPMLLEATRLLEEGLVRDARDIDLGLIFGIGFPPFRGGLMYWADEFGAAKVLEMLQPYQSLGVRFYPTGLLQHLASVNGSFYGPDRSPPAGTP